MVQDNKYRKGAASLYVVIFTTLLLGIITLSFIRIMLSEASQTSSRDISQSAYDSALAGIEDAKVALLRYNECLSEGKTANSAAGDGTCEKIISIMQSDDNPCDIVRNILGREAGDAGETIIQSEKQDGQSGKELQQAYTCVTVSEENPDYLGQLNENYRTKLIPIRTDQLDRVEKIKFQWFSSENGGVTKNNPKNDESNTKYNKVEYNDNNSGWFESAQTPAPKTPPTLSLQLIQTNEIFKLSDLNNNKDANTNRGTLILYPSTNGVSTIGNSASVGFASSADKSPNNPIAVKCNHDEAFRCLVEISIPEPYNGGNRNDGSTFLRVTAPYGSPETDFSVTLLDKDNKIINFVGVQAKIDSTGRANDFFRRVESRVELVDTYYPLPEFAVMLNGDEGEDALKKNFWVTTNPWGGMSSGYVE